MFLVFLAFPVVSADVHGFVMFSMSQIWISVIWLQIFSYLLICSDFYKTSEDYRRFPEFFLIFNNRNPDFSDLAADFPVFAWLLRFLWVSEFSGNFRGFPQMVFGFQIF